MDCMERRLARQPVPAARAASARAGRTFREVRLRTESTTGIERATVGQVESPVFTGRGHRTPAFFGLRDTQPPVRVDPTRIRSRGRVATGVERPGARPLRGHAELAYASTVRACVAVGALVLLAVAVGGCATILPFERERLSRPDMALASSPELMSAEGHATEVREGAVGGLGGGGGGCGCN
jgi:hypothetical protein